LRSIIGFSMVVLLALSMSANSWAQGSRPTTAAPAPATSTAQATGTPASGIDERTLSLADPATGVAGNGGAAGSSSIVPYFLRMVLVLGLVIAALYGIFALLRRSARNPEPADSYLRVLASVNIAAGRSIQVVALGDKAWLVGSTESSVNLIAAIDDKEVVDALALRAAASPETPRKDFMSMLLGSLGRKVPKKTGTTDSSVFFNKQRDRLKRF
jgi:flagellar biogenesis protein FliO